MFTKKPRVSLNCGDCVPNIQNRISKLKLIELTLVGGRGAWRRQRCRRRAPPRPPADRASSSGCAPSSAARQRPALPEERPSWLHAPRIESGTRHETVGERGRSLSTGAQRGSRGAAPAPPRSALQRRAAASRLQIFAPAPHRFCTAAENRVIPWAFSFAQPPSSRNFVAAQLSIEF